MYMHKEFRANNHEERRGSRLELRPYLNMMEDYREEVCLLSKSKKGGLAVMSVNQAAEKWGISPRRVSRLCLEGRIPGAYKPASRFWIIPASAKRPADNRYKKLPPEKVHHKQNEETKPEKRKRGRPKKNDT